MQRTTCMHVCMGSAAVQAHVPFHARVDNSGHTELPSVSPSSASQTSMRDPSVHGAFVGPCHRPSGAACGLAVMDLHAEAQSIRSPRRQVDTGWRSEDTPVTPMGPLPIPPDAPSESLGTHVGTTESESGSAAASAHPCPIQASLAGAERLSRCARTKLKRD